MSVCVTSGLQLIMLIHRRGVSKPAKRSSISFFSRFILPSLPPLPSSHLQAVGGKVEEGGKVKIQRYYFSHAQYAATYVYVCLACSFDDCLPVEERLPLERFK